MQKIKYSSISSIDYPWDYVFDYATNSIAAVYLGSAAGKAMKVTALYIGDENGKARKVLKVYIGDKNGKAQLCYK
jgi:hypothetical protein